jgi:hypothetical protein
MGLFWPGARINASKQFRPSSKKLEHLLATVSLHVVHYNFCRSHCSLKLTPAIIAKITEDPWTMEELLMEAASN